jgi:hypothetical protein
MTLNDTIAGQRSRALSINVDGMLIKNLSNCRIYSLLPLPENRVVVGSAHPKTGMSTVYVGGSAHPDGLRDGLRA